MNNVVNLEKKFQDGMNWGNYGKIWQIGNYFEESLGNKTSSNGGIF